MDRSAFCAPFLVGEWRVDLRGNRLSRGSETVKVDPRAMSVLVHLATRAGEVVLQSELEQQVWGDVVVTPNSTYQAITHLRRALGDERQAPRYIETISRRGYRLIAAVVPIEQPERLPQEVERRRALRCGALLLAATLALSLGYYALWRPRSAAAMPSIVVLPFVDMTTGQTEQALCDGLTEEVSAWLAHVPTLRVIARTSAFAVREHAQDVRRVGQLLDVTHALEGSVRKEAGSVRVTVQLVETDGGVHLWAQTFDHAAGNLLRLQEEIGRSVAAALRIELLREPVRGTDLRNKLTPSLYEDYALAKHRVRQRTPESIARAIEVLKSIIRAAPEFAPAYAALGDAYLAQYQYANSSLQQTIALASPAIERAIALDERLPEAYASRGVLRMEQFQLAEAIQDLRLAIALNRNFGEAYLRLAVALHYDGQLQDALHVLDEAAALDPMHLVLHTRRCLILQNLRSYDAAMESCERALEIEPAQANAHWSMALLAMSRGETATAVEWYRRSLTLAPHRDDLVAELSRALLDLGLTSASQELLADFTRVVGAEAAMRIPRIRHAISLGSKAAASIELSALSLQDNLSMQELFEASRLSLTVGEMHGARRFADRALALPEFSTAQLKNPWLIWQGRSDLLTLASIAKADHDASEAAARIRELQTYLDYLEANGHKLHGLHIVRAQAFAASGDLDAAISQLQVAAGLGWRSTWWARQDPWLTPLRANQQFVKLLSEVDASSAAMRADIR